MKLDLILENVKNKYTMGLLEESDLPEIDLLKGKILINESVMTVRSMLVEGGLIESTKTILEESFVNTIIEESARGASYDKYFKIELNKAGYNSVDDIPSDEKKEFFDKIDSGWNSKKEPGKDGAK